MEAMEAVIQAQIREVPAFATAFRAIAARGDTEDLGVVAKTSLRQMVDSLSEEQLAEAREVFQLFDLDGKGEIGTRELSFALAQLGQHPTPEELDKMVAEFDDVSVHAFTYSQTRLPLRRIVRDRRAPYPLLNPGRTETVPLILRSS